VTITTVLLDVDGTLLDTRAFIFAAFEHALGAHGVPLPERDWLTAQIGKSLDEIYASLAEAAVEALVETHRTFQAENLHLSVAFEGAAGVLKALRDAGMRLGAVTSRSRRTSVLTLEQSGLLPFFDAVVSAEDTERLKPDPEPLRKALEMLGRGPESAAMVGDTPADVEAGKALGMFTVGATYGFFGPGIAESAPDALIADLRELLAALPRASGRN